MHRHFSFANPMPRSRSGCLEGSAGSLMPRLRFGCPEGARVSGGLLADGSFDCADTVRLRL